MGIHLEKFPIIPSNWNNKVLNAKWTELIRIRDKCNNSIELKGIKRNRFKLRSRFKNIFK